MTIQYNFQHLNLSLDANSLVPQWLPNGKVRGNEYVVKNPLRNDRTAGSFTINLITGKWADFATGDKGGDLVSLYAYINSISNPEAFRMLSEGKGKYTSSSANYSRKKPVILPINKEKITRKEAKLLEVCHGINNRTGDRFHVYDQNDDYLDCLPEGKIDVHHSRAYWHTKVYEVLKGKNWSVAGLKVPHYYPVIPIDIDDELNPVETLINVLNRLQNAGIDSSAIKVYFSGNRGFHVTFYNKAIDKLNGRIDTSDKIVELILKPLFGTSIDLQNYKCNGLIRYVNSIHPKSGLYKIPLLKREVKPELTMNYCRNIATKQRFTNE